MSKFQVGDMVYFKPGEYTDYYIGNKKVNTKKPYTIYRTIKVNTYFLIYLDYLDTWYPEDIFISNMEYLKNNRPLI